MHVDDEVVRRWGNDGVWSSTMAARRSTVVSSVLQNRRENGNEEERGGQFTKRSSRGWSSPRSAMAAVSFAKSSADGAAFW
jgi:hypothetical protein